MTAISVKELLEYAIEGEHSVLAHTIYWSMTTQGIAMKDDSQKLLDLPFDRDNISQLVQQNLLGMGQIKLYVVKVKADLFAFYFAHNALEASTHHSRLFYQKATCIVDAERSLYKYMYLVDIDKHMMLIDYRKELLQFPAYLGHAKANDHKLYRLDQQQKGMNRVV